MKYTGSTLDLTDINEGIWKQFYADPAGNTGWESIETGEQIEAADGSDLDADDLRGFFAALDEEDDVNDTTGNGIILGTALVNAAIDDGGATFVVSNTGSIPHYLRFQPAPFTSGYYIGGTGEGLEFTEDNVNFMQIAGWLARQADDNYPGKTSWLVGSWIEDGTIYLDLTVHRFDLDEALELGRKHNQISIWDIANAEAIYC